MAAEIRAELARQRKTRASLSAALGVNRNTLRRRLSGLTPFYVEELELVCSFLNISLADLLERARSEEAA